MSTPGFFQPSYDWDPFPFGGIGHAQSVLARMDREMQMLRDEMFANMRESFGGTGGLLDFLNNAYEPGEDGRVSGVGNGQFLSQT